MAHNWEKLINMAYYHIAVALETVDVSCLRGKQKCTHFKSQTLPF